MSRLKFQLKKIRIEPLVHLRILRHATQSGEAEVTGQLYGMYDDQIAEVTNIMPIDDQEREEMDPSERRFEENLPKFNFDCEKLGWYCVEHRKNFWNNIDMCGPYEDYIKTSFYLVFDFNVSQRGGNPYRAYRLKNEFATKQNFTWKDLSDFNYDRNFPFDEIPVEIIRNPLAEALLEFNKKSIFQGFQEADRLGEEIASKELEGELKNYSGNVEARTSHLRQVGEQFLKAKEEVNDRKPILERPVRFEIFCSNLSDNLILADHEQDFKQRQKNIEGAYRLLESIIQ